MDNVLYLHLAARKPEQVAFSPDEQAALDKINAKVAGARDLDEVMNLLYETTQSICPCDRLGLAFVEENGQRVAARWARAEYEPLLLKTGYTEDLAGSSLEQVLRERQPRIINDLEHYLREHPESRSTKIILKEGVRASMTCPLLIDDRVVGLLFRSCRRPHAYDVRQMALHQAITERLSQAVEKAWRIKQLEEANKAYFEMLGFVSHELKSPVASLVTDARLLTEGYLGDLEDRQKAKIERMIAKGEYLLGLVREYLDLAHIEGGDLEPAFEDMPDLVNKVLEPSIDIVMPQIEAKSMRVSRDFSTELPPIKADSNLLKIVVVNLIGNGCKYGREGGAIKIAAQVEDARIRISVWNEGPGFAVDQRSRLFRKFSRLKSPELMKQKGTGVGLYTCWRIVQLHGGRIDAHSEEGAWAMFHFTLPVN